MNYIKTDNLIETFAQKTADLFELVELICNEREHEYIVTAKVKDNVSRLDLISAGQDQYLDYLTLRGNIVHWYTKDKHYDSEGLLSYGFGLKRDYTKRALQMLRDEYLENN